MLVLGIDCSDGVSVALCRDHVVLARADGADPRRHAETLAPAVAWVLEEAGAERRDLDAVAVGTGPAPFTGLRVGLVTAKALARALGIPAYGVGSLDVLARQAFDVLGAGSGGEGDDGEVVVAADARRREVYAGRYRRAGEDVVAIDGPAVATAADVRSGLEAALSAAGTSWEAALASGAIAVVGRGARLYPDALPPAAGGPVAVDAAVLARLARHRVEHGGDLDLAPRYLRRPDVTLPAARKRAS